MKRYTPPTRYGPAMLALCLGLTQLVSAATYTLNLHAEGASNIGKYTADPDAVLEGVLANYDLQATSAGGTRFWTFCLESQVYFESGKIYHAEISSSTDSVTGRDPLSNGTAFLYKQFASGQLASSLNDGFAYDVSGGTRLQNMIWWLEGEAAGTQDAGMWTLLNSALGSTALDEYVGSSVKVLNLTKYSGSGGDQLNSSYGTFRQDQLVYLGTPPPEDRENVPDGGTTLLLLSSALGGLGLARRWTRMPKP